MRRSHRSIIAPIVLLVAACRADPPRAASLPRSESVAPHPRPTLTEDGCRQVGGQRPDTTLEIGSPAAGAWRRAVARGVEYRCEIDPSLVLRIAVLGDSAPPSLDSVVVRTDSTPARIVQVFPRGAEAEVPLPSHRDLLRAIDLDADGHRDLLVGKFWGATGNRGYDVWRFDPRTRRFFVDTAFTGMWNPDPIAGRPCVSTWSNSSARDDEMAVFCLHAGRWILDSLESNTWQRTTHRVEHTIMARRRDSLVVLQRETRPDSE